MQLKYVTKINISLNRTIDTQKRENIYFFMIAKLHEQLSKWPRWWQDRYVETRDVGKFFRDETLPRLDWDVQDRERNSACGECADRF